MKTPEAGMASASAVVIVETPTSYALEARPTRPGQLAYSGKLQLFGGHRDEGEPADVTAARELREELAIDTTPTYVWEGVVDSRNKYGQPVPRHVSLFHTEVSSIHELTLQVPGDIVEVPKNYEGIQAHAPRLTAFAFRSLLLHNASQRQLPPAPVPQQPELMLK